MAKQARLPQHGADACVASCPSDDSGPAHRTHTISRSRRFNEKEFRCVAPVSTPWLCLSRACSRLNCRGLRGHAQPTAPENDRDQQRRGHAGSRPEATGRHLVADQLQRLRRRRQADRGGGVRAALPTTPTATSTCRAGSTTRPLPAAAPRPSTSRAGPSSTPARAGSCSPMSRATWTRRRCRRTWASTRSGTTRSRATRCRSRPVTARASSRAPSGSECTRSGGHVTRASSGLASSRMFRRAPVAPVGLVADAAVFTPSIMSIAHSRALAAAALAAGLLAFDAPGARAQDDSRATTRPCHRTASPDGDGANTAVAGEPPEGRSRARRRQRPWLCPHRRAALVRGASHPDRLHQRHEHGRPDRRRVRRRHEPAGDPGPDEGGRLGPHVHRRLPVQVQDLPPQAGQAGLPVAAGVRPQGRPDLARRASIPASRSRCSSIASRCPTATWRRSTTCRRRSAASPPT